MENFKKKLADSFAKTLHRELYFLDKGLSEWSRKFRVRTYSSADPSGYFSDTMELRDPLPGESLKDYRAAVLSAYFLNNRSFMWTRAGITEEINSLCGPPLDHIEIREVFTHIRIILFIDKSNWHWRFELYHDVFRMMKNSRPLMCSFEIECITVMDNKLHTFKSVLTV